MVSLDSRGLGSFGIRVRNSRLAPAAPIAVISTITIHLPSGVLSAQHILIGLRLGQQRAACLIARDLSTATRNLPSPPSVVIPQRAPSGGVDGAAVAPYIYAASVGSGGSHGRRRRVLHVFPQHLTPSAAALCPGAPTRRPGRGLMP